MQRFNVFFCFFGFVLILWISLSLFLTISLCTFDFTIISRSHTGPTTNGKNSSIKVCCVRYRFVHVFLAWRRAAIDNNWLWWFGDYLNKILITTRNTEKHKHTTVVGYMRYEFISARLLISSNWIFKFCL